MTAAIRAEPGTLHYVLEDDDQYVNVPNLTQAIPVTAFVGNAGWTGYALIRGHWYTGPGQVDAPTAFLKTTGTHVGDAITLTAANGHRIPVRIVGELFTHDPNQGVALFTSWQTLTGGSPALVPDPSDVQYDVGLRPGSTRRRTPTLSRKNWAPTTTSIPTSWAARSWRSRWSAR